VTNASLAGSAGAAAGPANGRSGPDRKRWWWMATAWLLTGCLGAGDTSPDFVVAEVASTAITQAELDRRFRSEPGLADEVAGLGERALYDARSMVLERLIAETLLGLDAATRGETLQDVLAAIEREIVITEAESQASLQFARTYAGDDPRTKRRCERLLGANEKEARERLLDFNRRERMRLAILHRAIPLRETTKVVRHLAVPADPAAPR